MTLPESDALWARHLAGEPLRPWEEERLLQFLAEDGDLKEAALRDLEMDGMLRMVDRARRDGDAFLREIRSLLAAEKERTRTRNRERTSARFARAGTTRRIARISPAPAPVPVPALIAAAVLLALGLLWASSPAPARPAPQVRRPIVVDEPAAPPPAPRPKEAPPKPAEPEPPSGPLIPRLAFTPLPAPEPPAPAPESPRDTRTVVATLDRVEGEVLVRTGVGFLPAKAGQELLAGHMIATVGPRSRAVVTYPDTTRFHLRGDSLVQVSTEGAAKRVSLSSGSLSIRVAKQAAHAPMDVLTPVARITVVGTRFSVASGPKATRVLVDEGRVRLTLLASGETVEAGAGDCAGAAAGRIWAERPIRTYAAPADWKGSKTESAQGNPFRVDGRPTWRLDQIWPDDPGQVDHYAPLVWSGLLWHAAEQAPGGQPSAESADGTIGLGVRTWWPDQLGSKLASLAFIAPADGVYAVDGLARVELREGAAERPLVLQVLTLDRKERQVVEVASIPLASPQLLELRGLTVPLRAQQELIFLPRLPERGRVAATCLLEDLRLHRFPGKP